MIKTFYIEAIVCIFIFIFISEPSIKISPFSISLPGWKYGTAMVLLIFGLSLYRAHYRDVDYRDGWNDSIDQLEKIIEEKKLEATQLDKDTVSVDLKIIKK